jgi:hypothetical protein
MQEQALIKLIDALQRDIPVLASFACNFELNFVYCKFSTSRLFSIYKHEQNHEE